KGAEVVKRDITVEPGSSFKGTVIGPDGKSLAGARIFDLNSQHMWGPEPLKTCECAVYFNPRWPKDILGQDRDKGLSGTGRPRKEDGGSVTVKLDRGAAVTGRLVDADGKPRAGVELEMFFRVPGKRYWDDYSRERITTDGEGRFRVGPLLPGYEYRLADSK